jgi:hypothetical protein
MKGRKSAALPGIVMAAVAVEDDCEFGEEVRKYLIRCGLIIKNEDGKYEAC